MIREIVLACIISLSSLGFSVEQKATFEVVGKANIETIIQATGKLDISEIKIINTSQKTIALKWERVENTFVEGWDYSMCAYGVCQIGIPESGKFKMLGPGDEGFLAVHVLPKGKTGTGNANFVIYDVLNDELKIPISFTVTAN